MLSKEASSTIFWSLWYDSTWDWTSVSQTIGKHINYHEIFLFVLIIFFLYVFLYMYVFIYIFVCVYACFYIYWYAKIKCVCTCLNPLTPLRHMVTKTKEIKWHIPQTIIFIFFSFHKIFFIYVVSSQEKRGQRPKNVMAGPKC